MNDFKQMPAEIDLSLSSLKDVKGRISLGATALLVVDAVNDSVAPNGAFDKPGLDLCLMREAVPKIDELIRAGQSARMPIIQAIPIYDTYYLPCPMREPFSPMQLPPTALAAKGSWGIRFLEELPRYADYVVIKSHFSAFVPGFTLAYKADAATALQAYLQLPSAHDAQLRGRGERTLPDYYAEALEKGLSQRIGSPVAPILQSATDTVTLGPLLLGLGLRRLIVCGFSTHVCVASTVYSAHERDFQILLPIDAVASEDRTEHSAYLHTLSRFVALSLTTNDLVRIMGQDSKRRI